MRYWVSRLKEPSTWRGFIYCATALGANINPEQANAIVAAGLALAGLVGVFTAD